MIFLNALLAAGAAAAVIPLIIHLLNRTRFKMLDWGAMHLLESAIKINSRRVQWRAWLLLALRMAIPAVLAMILARPVLTAWRTAAGGSGHSVVLVIDNSLSMEAAADRQPTADGNSNRPGRRSRRSCFDMAIAEAQSLVKSFGSSTEWTVLTSGGGVIDQTAGPTFDMQRVERRLREIRSGTGNSQFSQALALGLQQLANARQARRHLILISDFQRSEFDTVSAESIAKLRQASGSTDDHPIEIAFISIPAATPENLSVQIDRPLGPSVVAHHQPLEVRVSIRNHGRQRAKDLPVVLKADGVALASKTVDVLGDSQVFLVFTCQLQTLGSHVLSVSIDEAAARAVSADPSNPSPNTGGVVTSDDISLWSLEVIEPVRVGIVSTKPPSSKTVDDAMFLNLALSPYAVSLASGAMSEETAGWAEAHAGADPIQCETVQPDAIHDQWLSGRDCVALTDIPKLDDDASAAMERFVEQGGVLIVWAGDELQSQWYNQRWGAASQRRLLPMDYGKVSRPAERAQKSLKLQSQSYDHPALVFFNRSSNGRLDSIDFQSWYQLSPTARSNNLQIDNPLLVLLSLENGDPLLVEHRVGRGRVYQWATSCDGGIL